MEDDKTIDPSFKLQILAAFEVQAVAIEGYVPPHTYGPTVVDMMMVRRANPLNIMRMAELDQLLDSQKLVEPYKEAIIRDICNNL